MYQKNMLLMCALLIVACLILVLWVLRSRRETFNRVYLFSDLMRMSPSEILTLSQSQKRDFQTLNKEQFESLTHEQQVALRQVLGIGHEIGCQ